MRTSTAWRNRLLAQIGATPLTVLHGPGGSGKTTLLRAWADLQREAGRPVLWVTLTPDVTSAQDAWEAVVEAAACAGAPDDVIAALRRPTSRGRRLSSTHALARALPGVTVVLDRCEYLTDRPAVFWQTLTLVASLHHDNQIVVASRWIAPDVVTGLLLDPGTHVIDPVTLTALPDEVTEIITSAGLSATPALLEASLAHAGGDLRTLGAAVLHLTAYRPSSGTDTSTENTIEIDWAELRVAQAQRDLDQLDLTDLVRRTAWLPHLDTTTVSLVTGDSPASVEHDLGLLEHQGLCHRDRTAHAAPVLRWSEHAHACAAHRSGLSGVDVDPEVADAVINQMVAIDAPGAALEAAVRARRLDRASSLYRRLAISRPSELTPGFDAALREVPTRQLLGHPLLSVARGVALMDNPATRSAAQQFLEPIAHRDSSALNGDSAEDRLIDLTVQSVILGSLGRRDASVAAATDAAALLHSPGFAAASCPLADVLACQLSRTLVEAGETEAGQHLISQALAAARPENAPLCAVHGRAYYAIDGRMPEALAMHAQAAADDALPPNEAGSIWGPRTESMARVGQALIKIDDFDVAGASAHLRGDTEDFDPTDHWVQFLRAAFSLANGSFSAMAPVLTAELEARPVVPSFATAHFTTFLALAWLATGQVTRAHSVLALGGAETGIQTPALLVSEMLTSGPAAALDLAPHLDALPGHTVRSRAALETLTAAVALRIGNQQTARDRLLRSVALHANHGVRAHLTMMDRVDLQAVIDLGRSLALPTVDAFLEGSETLFIGSTARPLMPVLLTERETAVLFALVHEPSRRAIAQRLHVSENTVKSQLRSLYRKLDVTDRASAIIRAVDLALLPGGVQPAPGADAR
ncbi:helix-turn-helix transcriptional regulator [Nocardioides yefusunii]|uniref:LuxR C-terminal-related transcriptional regulator n=1 Tax=Nocardioides yefusunii TaxID=2500546 RepID=A0ABW1R0L8_9ACTN|nr:LuxR family transcriptional regulator [Nocardioides yefusunii]